MYTEAFWQGFYDWLYTKVFQLEKFCQKDFIYALTMEYEICEHYSDSMESIQIQIYETDPQIVYFSIIFYHI